MGSYIFRVQATNNRNEKAVERRLIHISKFQTVRNTKLLSSTDYSYFECYNTMTIFDTKNQ